MKEGFNKIFIKNKKIFAILIVLFSVLFIFIGTYAFYFDDDINSNSVTISKLSIGKQNLEISSPLNISEQNLKFSKNIDVWNPGDIRTIKWKVENTGNIPMVTRNTVYLYWEEDLSSNVDFKNYVYLYPYEISNTIIKEEMINKKPINNLNIGDYTSTININGNSTKCFKYTFMGDYLDGVGENAITGMSKEENYSSPFDEQDPTYDVPSFKLVLSPHVNVETSGKKMKIIVLTEGLQYTNTSDGTWETISVQNFEI